MLLGLIVLGAVMVVTAVFALAAYLIDKGEERLEDEEGLDEKRQGDAGTAKFVRL